MIGLAPRIAAAAGRALRLRPAGTHYSAAPRADAAQARIPSGVLCSIARRPLAKARAGDRYLVLDASNVSRGSAVVRTFVVEFSTDIVAKARSCARALVEREHRLTLSKMLAYERVAASVGASPGWLRKFVGGYEAKPDLIVGFNIIALHAQINSKKLPTDEGACHGEMELDDGA